VPILETVNNYARNTGEAKTQALVTVTLPPVGPASFQITPTSEEHAHPVVAERPSGDVTLENELVALHFSGATGRLQTWVNKATGLKLSVDQEFCFYRSSTGDQYSGQASGAYIFRPDSANSSCTPVAQGPAQIVSVSQGSNVQELTQVATRITAHLSPPPSAGLQRLRDPDCPPRGGRAPRRVPVHCGSAAHRR
jgi:hypothetical protein